MSQKKNIEMIERRRYLRLLDYFQVDMRPLELPSDAEGPGEPSRGFSKNLSLGGVCLVSRDPVASGQLIHATIHIPELASPLQVSGEVVRCRPHQGDRYEVAVRFLPSGMDDSARADLERFLYRHFV